MMRLKFIFVVTVKQNSDRAIELLILFTRTCETYIHSLFLFAEENKSRYVSSNS